jgi:hypothetical protein
MRAQHAQACVYCFALKALRLDGQVSNLKHIRLDKQLAIFLYTCTTGLSTWHVAKHFQRSFDTINWSVLMRSLDILNACLLDSFILESISAISMAYCVLSLVLLAHSISCLCNNPSPATQTLCLRGIPNSRLTLTAPSEQLMGHTFPPSHLPQTQLAFAIERGSSLRTFLLPAPFIIFT